MPSESEPLLVLTNDDGVDAPGLAALLRAARDLGRPRVIAPSGPVSGCGHRATTHEPIAIRRLADDWVAVAGTPVDCVRLAIHHLASDLSWILSGINSGGNLGTDVHHSGTVAAVREAAIHGKPGIAVSHYIARGQAIDWKRAQRWTHRVLRLLLAIPWIPGTFWNVNLPHPAPRSKAPRIVFCPLDPSPLPLDYRVEDNVAVYSGDYQARRRCPGGDVEVCFGGQIAVTRLRLEGTQNVTAAGRESSVPRPDHPDRARDLFDFPADMS
jgi:5'-nucleotidase